MPHKAIFCGDIHLHRPYIGLIYGRYLHFRIEIPIDWMITGDTPVTGAGKLHDWRQ